MTEEMIAQRLSTEGADLLTLAGVNDANLVELARLTGVKVALRGEALTLSGSTEDVERAAPVAQRMIDAAKQRTTITPDDVLRMSEEGPLDSDGAAPGAQRIALGFDRMAMLLAGASSLRDVIAFPKTTAGRALFEDAPTSVPDEDLRELHVDVREEATT